jgi:hypothetical protein
MPVPAPEKQQPVPLAILRHTRAGASRHVHLVALNDQHVAGVVSEDARRQQARDTATQHADGVEHDSGLLGYLDPDDPLEHGSRRFSHDYSSSCERRPDRPMIKARQARSTCDQRWCRLFSPGLRRSTVNSGSVVG